MPAVVNLETASLLAGGWHTVCMVGKHGDFDFNRKRLGEVVDNYDPSFECATFNLDHTHKGPSLAKIPQVRALGDHLQVRVNPKTVSKVMREAVESEAYFRFSSEIYPAFSKLEGKPAYLRGVALMGNGSVEVRGMPEIRLESEGEAVVCFADQDNGEGFVALTATTDWRDNVPVNADDSKKPLAGGSDEIARLETERAEAVVKLKANEDEIARLKADKAKADEDYTRMVDRVTKLEASRELEAKEARETGNAASVDRLIADRKVTPGERAGWLVILNAQSPDVVIKLEAGGKTEDVKGGAASIVKMLEQRQPVIQFGDNITTRDIAAPVNLGSVDAEARRLTNEALAKKEITEAQAGDAYLGHYKRLEAALPRTN